MNELALTEYVRSEGTEVKTTSRLVAEKFGRQHKNVVRNIQNLLKKSRLSFEPSTYLDERGKSQTEYQMSRKSFMLLAMRFTGDEAIRVQEAFIDAFELMAQQLREYQEQRPSWIAARNEGKVVRRLATDVMATFIEYAKGQGSQSAEKYYMIFSKMVNAELLELDGVKLKNLRDHLNIHQIHAVSVADHIIAKELVECMAKGLPYKDVYQIAKQKIQTLSSTVGRTRIGQSERQMLGMLA